MNQATVRLEGAPNFRDLGGYRAFDGARVRDARLFRSDALARLSESDLERLAGLGIGLLYDLRGASEREREPNRWPESSPVEVLTGFEGDGLAAVRVHGWRERVKDPAFDAAAAQQWMLDAYGSMPALFAGMLGSLFARLADGAAPPVLVHCTAGKDRTGFVCAMLLLALGVTREDVFEDYLLTMRRRPPETLLRVLMGDAGGELAPATAAALHTMACVREDYLGAALRAVERDYGAVDAYLARACGLTPERRALLRAHLLE